MAKMFKKTAVSDAVAKGASFLRPGGGGLVDFATALRFGGRIRPDRDPSVQCPGLALGSDEVCTQTKGQASRGSVPAEERSVICFTPGTGIATARGLVPVEEMRPGDKVITRDNGYQKLKWVGQQTLSTADLVLTPELRPIRIRKHALGDGLPSKDVTVSPDHRVLIKSKSALLLFGTKEVLVRAEDLLRMPGVHRVDPQRTTYVHLLFEEHEVILTDTIWTESFQPSERSVGGLDTVSREEIVELFPELSGGPAGPVGYAPVRRSLDKHEALLLVR